MACPSPESLMQSCTKLSYLKKVVRKDRMLLLTGAEVLQSFQRQVVVIMRNNWLPLLLFPTFVGSPRYQILHLPHANCPSSSDCEVELPEVQWDTATTFAGGKRRGHSGPLCLLVQLGFWYTLFTEKENKKSTFTLFTFSFVQYQSYSFPKSYCNTKTRSLGRNL